MIENLVYEHNINPVAFNIFSQVDVYWYGILYAVGLLLTMFFIKFLDSRRATGRHIFSSQAIDSLSMYIIIGVIVGARLAYVIFYKPEWIMDDFMKIFKIRLGGLSFHGGLIGAGVAIYLFVYIHRNELFLLYYHDSYLSCKSFNLEGLHLIDYLSYNRKLLQYIEELILSKEEKLSLLRNIRSKMAVIWLYIFDLGACSAPIGLFLGRIGNFINGELRGRYTNQTFGVLFQGDQALRHPSQLYEAALEGIVLFVIVNALRFWMPSIILRIKHRYNKILNIKNGFLFGIFCFLYGIFRITLEIYREPDSHIGFFLSHITLGQILTAPMILIGSIIIYRTTSIRNICSTSRSNDVVIKQS